MKWVYNQRAERKNLNERESLDLKPMLQAFSQSEVEQVRKFHRSFEQYEATPLRRLSNLASFLGVRDVFVKDESYRFGLNAFKVLGGIYAIGKHLAERLGMDVRDVTFDDLRSPEVKEKLGELTFISATDGNHGRGVAWAAQQLGQRAVIYMPRGAAPIRLENIRATGAEAYETEFNYDETVRMCRELAEENGWVLMQDTAWDGYEEIPTWIMQGYMTMVDEAIEQMRDIGMDKPTHVFMQSGVGSYPAAVQGYLASLYGDQRPMTVVVEPNQAECFYLSALDAEGEAQKVTGDMNTIMAGLACGEPNPIAWDLLRALCDVFVSCPDEVAARGMRILGNPLGDDERVIAGESGAVTLGLLSDVMRRESLSGLRERLGLDARSRVLLFNTEGDTDPGHYREVVWDGKHPSCIP